jgi:putative multiple sugar transport system ATP-binding protein
MTVTDNVVIASLPRTMPSGFYNKLRAAQLATGSKEKLRIAASDIFQRAGTLSGGNQQKVMLAKWLHTDPDLLIIDEPTHGVDVGAKYEIYNILKSLAAQGKGILMISSELPELTGLCDRIIVLKKGSIAGELTDEKMTEENVIRLAT